MLSPALITLSSSVIRNVAANVLALTPESSAKLTVSVLVIVGESLTPVTAGLALA